ncbi:MAG: response regulator transcription factor [Alphaproteobacteria bacterium]|nr:response regulator transcription factor [Alphaproteobacteria bacterium]
MRIRAVLADDEPLARQRLAGLLEREGDVELVATCADGREALQQIRREAPDLVFLDIRMPELDGVEVARRVLDEQAPAVVFVTAYDRHAIEAFDLNALDYLLKPYCRERFGRCMDRVRQRLREAPEPDLAQRLSALLAGEGQRPRRLELKDGADIIYLPVGEVDWVESAGNYVVVHTGGATHLERATMSEMEQRLGDPVFLRCHRSAIVNTRRVRALHTPSAGELHITLSSGERVPLSRRYVDALREVLCQG